MRVIWVKISGSVLAHIMDSTPGIDIRMSLL